MVVIAVVAVAFNNNWVLLQMLLIEASNLIWINVSTVNTKF